MAMAYQHLISERSGGVERVTLNRPDLRNALNDEVVAELTHWAARVREHHEVRVAVLSGSVFYEDAGAGDCSEHAALATRSPSGA